jgi:NTP pyrophosphatase (non-canonical NTP hydrolase)
LDDSTTRIIELKQMVQRFSDERDWDKFHSAKDLAIGIVTEASELLEIFRFKSEDDIRALFGDNASAQKVKDELADVFYFSLRLAQKYNIDISEALRAKIEQNAKKYPVKKAKGSNKKYSEFER